MFSMTKKQANRWIAILSIGVALVLAGAAALLLWVGAAHGLTPTV